MIKQIRCCGKMWTVESHLSGWWSVWSDAYGGYLKADTINGIKRLIEHYESRNPIVCRYK